MPLSRGAAARLFGDTAVELATAVRGQWLDVTACQGVPESMALELMFVVDRMALSLELGSTPSPAELTRLRRTVDDLRGALGLRTRRGSGTEVAHV